MNNQNFKDNQEFLSWLKGSHYERLPYRSIEKFLHSSSTLNTCIFRDHNYWYRFENWDMPNSGIIRRWQVKDKDDWLPKNNYTDYLKEENSLIIFNAENLSLYLRNYNIKHVVFSPDGVFVLAIVSKGKVNDLIVSKISEMDKKPIIIKNISIEASFCFMHNSVLYARCDHKNRPFKLYEFFLTTKFEKLLYIEQDNSFRIRIQDSDYQDYGIVQIEKLARSDVFICSYKSNFKMQKVWSRNNPAPINIILISLKKEICVGFSFKTSDHNYVIVLSTTKKGKLYRLKEINNKLSIDRLVGIGNNIIVKYKKDLCQSQTKLGIITISPSFLSNGKTEYQEIICNGHIKIFDNNFSQNHLIIQSTKNSVSEDFISYNLQQDLIPEIFLSRHIYNNNLSPQINRLYSSTLIWANARDQKNNIPISMYWIKTNVNEKLPKNRKGILSVYGAYGQKEDSYKLDPIALSIINQGFVYCMVHVRGSGFLDSSWYKQVD